MFCADPNYVVPLAVALRSLARVHVRADSFEVVVLADGIEAPDQVRLRSAANPLRVRFVDMGAVIPPDLPVMAHLSRAAYGRLLGVDLLSPVVQRVVYLDCDLIVVESLDPLFGVPLDGSVLAAVQDAVIPHVSNPMGLRNWRELDLSPTTDYLNSGVIVIDPQVWREAHVSTRIIDYIRLHRNVLSLADQDGFNAVLRGDFVHLPLRWNQQSSLRMANHLGYSFHPCDEVEDAIHSPAIVHFSGGAKPWLRGCTDPLTSLWWEILSDTDYADYRFPTRHRTLKDRMIHSLESRIRRLFRK